MTPLEVLVPQVSFLPPISFYLPVDGSGSKSYLCIKATSRENGLSHHVACHIVDQPHIGGTRNETACVTKHIVK